MTASPSYHVAGAPTAPPRLSPPRKAFDPFGPYRKVPPLPSNRVYTPEEYVLLFKRFS